jgi:hypothetical protein
MRAFLETVELVKGSKKDYFDDFVYVSKYPLLNLGVEVIDFDGSDLKSLDKYDFNLKNDIIIGSVEATDTFFKKCGIKTPSYLGYPEELKHTKFLHREIKETSYFTADKILPYPFFIKPVLDVKLFTGSLCESKKQLDLVKFFEPRVTNETMVYISEPMDFLSEYRCFVHKKQLVGIKHYAGDFYRFPDIASIQNMIQAYKNCPVSYTLDVGIFKNNIYTGPKNYTTALVEVNDFWAIGGYGLDGKIYVRMTIDRFQEIYKNSLIQV